MPEDAVIVRSIIDLAHNLSLNVVAEGVEDEETMNLLIEYGCDAAQGYYFSRPVPKAELAKWLETSPFGVPRRMPRNKRPRERHSNRRNLMPATEPAPAELRARTPLQGWAKAGAWLLVVVGGVVLLGGWVIGLDPLKNIVPGAVQMKALTAIGLVFSGASLLLLIDAFRDRPAVASGLGLRRCADRSPGAWSSPSTCSAGTRVIDEFPFHDVGRTCERDRQPRAPGSDHRRLPRSRRHLTATLDSWPRSRWRVSELLAIPVMVVATASLIGYLYAIPAFYGPASAAKMALHTALCFLVIGIALVMARPRGRLLDLATTTAPGGTMARRLIPFVLLMPLLLGWVRLKLGDAGALQRSRRHLVADGGDHRDLPVRPRPGRCPDELARHRSPRARGRAFQLANHDQLTGLFNRHRFVEELARHAERTRRRTTTTALILVDLDRLKEINDRLGHEAGDDLIEGVGKAIDRRARATDIAARIGGDEFAVLLPSSTAEGAAHAAGDLLVAIREVLPASAATTGSSAASIGVAFTSPGHSTTGARSSSRRRTPPCTTQSGEAETASRCTRQMPSMAGLPRDADAD